MSSSTLFRRAWPAAALLALTLAAGARAADPRIAFAVDLSGDGRSSRIFVANPDGSGLRPLTPGTGRERSPAFSPDGKLLAYQTTNDLGLDSLMVVPVDGSKPPRHVAVGQFPQWSSDGQRLLFARRNGMEFSLFQIRADGMESDAMLKPLTRGQIGRWSRDEKSLAAVVPAIVSGRDRWQILVLPTGTLTPQLRITLPETMGQIVSLDWAPDNQSLLFTAARGPQLELFVLPLRSPEPRKVPQGEAVPNAAYGSWSPDGKEILFRSMVGTDGAALSRLCVMNADGTNVRTLWEPSDRSLRVQGTTWLAPTMKVAANPPAEVRNLGNVEPPKPAPNPAPPAPQPAQGQPGPPVPVQPGPAQPMPGPRVPGPAIIVHATKTFVISQARSPVSVRLAVPGEADFRVTVPLRSSPGWSPRRQGVGITLEMADGSLYRGTLIHSGVPWVTLQGRPKGGKVHLIDGKKLEAAGPGFPAGFELTIRREGPNLIVSVNDEDVLTRPVLSGAVKTAGLTLENFDPGDARFPVGNITYQRWASPGGDERPN